MNKQEYLLSIMAEEAGEVVQATTKIMRFGLCNYNPFASKPTDNENDLLTEFYQLQSVIEHLQAEGVLKTLSEAQVESIKEDKINKVYRYMEESIRVGTLSASDEDLAMISKMKENRKE